MSAVLRSRWSPWTVATVALTALLVAIGLALLVATGDPSGHAMLLALGIVVAPGLLALTLRAPLIFPFSLYVALVPIDRILAVSGAGGTVTRFVGILAAVALVASMALGRRAIVPGRGLLAWIAIVGWCTATLFWSVAPGASAILIGQIGMLAVLTAVMACYLPRRRELTFAFAAIAISSTIDALYGLHSFSSGLTFAHTDRLTILSADGIPVDPNDLSTSLLPGFAIAITMALATKRSWLRFGALGCAIIIAAAVDLSGSRGGFLAIIGVSAFAVVRMRSRVGAIVAVGAGVALLTLFPSIMMRFLNDPSGESSGSGRTFLWAIGLHALKSSFLFGAGIGAFPAVYDAALLTVPQRLFQGWSRPAHNVLVSSLVELGVVGTVLLIVAVVAFFRTLGAVDEPALQPLRIAVEATMWGIIVQSFFLDEITLKVVWLTAGLAFVLFNASRSVRS